jgi:transposase-like protein
MFDCYLFKKEVLVKEAGERQARAHVSEVVRERVGQTLNALPAAEADALCRTKRYERNTQRVGIRPGHYDRTFSVTNNIYMAIANGDYICFG